MTRRPKATPEEAHRVLKDQPQVGVTAASAILGVATANFKRYRDRLTAIPVEGSADVFLKSDVRELKKTLAAEKRAAERERRAAAKRRR